MSFPSGLEVKESAYNEGDQGLIPGEGRSPGEGNGNPLQCSCPENSMDRGAWWTRVYGVAKSCTRLLLAQILSVIKFNSVLLLFYKQEFSLVYGNNNYLYSC